MYTCSLIKVTLSLKRSCIVHDTKMSVRLIIILLSTYLSLTAHAQSITVSLSGDQTVLEGSNVTFKCYVDSSMGRLRSNWFLIFSDDRTNIRLQGGNYTPPETNSSLFYVPDLFPGLQVEFTFVRINLMFDTVEVQCFNGVNTNSSLVNVIRPFTFGENVSFTEAENTTGILLVSITTEGDDEDHNYTWTKNGIPLESNSRVEFLLRGINFIAGRGGMKRSDSGVYRLNVSNVLSYAVTYLTLDVQYPPEIAGSEVLQLLPFEIGVDYEVITCGLNSDSGSMLDGNPFPTITWSFNGTTIANDSAKYMLSNINLIVRDISRDDEGLYNCTAVNILGTDTIIYSIETYAVPSAPVNITEDTIGNTTALITWDAPEDTDGLQVHSYIIYLMWNSLPQEQGQQTRTTGNSTSVLLKNLLPGLNYTVVVAAVTERLERFFEGNLSVPLTFTTMTGSPVLGETINSTIGDDIITIQWFTLTNGGERIVEYRVDWIIPGSSQYTRAPGGTVGSDATYLQINLGRVLAGRNYRYRIQAVNSEGFVSNYVFHELQSSKGLPASPSMPHITVEGTIALVALRTDITGIVSNNVTLIFEVEAISSNTSEILIRNFTITGYISFSDVSIGFNGLRERHYYTFRSRVFNIYGGSQYSPASTGTLTGSVEEEGTESEASDRDDDDDDDDTGVIIGAVVGGTLLFILGTLVLFIIIYVLLHHRTQAASYAINGDDSPEKYVDEGIPQYGDNPQYGVVKMGNSLSVSAYDDVSIPTKPMMDNGFEKRPYELTISVNSNEKGHLHPIKSTEDLVSPQQTAVSSTLV